jgi:hypothetical protein
MVIGAPLSAPIFAAPPNSNIVEDDHGGFIVYPTATYPDDCNNIQWAVNNVTTEGMPVVLLKATGLSGEAYFDFGTELIPFNFRVDIQKNCILSGESDSSGKLLTTIKNGVSLFGINTPSFLGNPQLPPQANKVIIKDLVSDGGSIHWCGAYWDPVSDVEINNVHIINFIGYPGYPYTISLFTHNIGSWTVKNCYVQMKDTQDVKINNTLNLAIASNAENSVADISGNTVITPGNGIGLVPALTGKIYSNVISAVVGIIADGPHNVLIKSNKIEANAEVGIQLNPGFEYLNPSISFNTIEANKVVSASYTDYLLVDSIWFPNPQGFNRGELKVDLAAYPHVRNNGFLNAIGGSNLKIVNIDLPTLARFGNYIDSSFNVIVATENDNPHARAEAQGPKIMNMYKTACGKIGGKWDPVNNKCIY